MYNPISIGSSTPAIYCYYSLTTIQINIEISVNTYFNIKIKYSVQSHVINVEISFRKPRLMLIGNVN